MVTEAKRQQQRRANAADWPAGEVLLAGELGVETDTGRVKVGDGVSAWSTLEYLDELSAASVGSVLRSPMYRGDAETTDDTATELASFAVDGSGGRVGGLVVAFVSGVSSAAAPALGFSGLVWAAYTADGGGVSIGATSTAFGGAAGAAAVTFDVSAGRVRLMVTGEDSRTVTWQAGLVVTGAHTPPASS